MGWLDLLAVVLGTRDKGCYAAKELLGGGFSGAVGGWAGCRQEVECGTQWSLDRQEGALKVLCTVTGHPPHVPDEPSMAPGADLPGPFTVGHTQLTSHRW